MDSTRVRVKTPRVWEAWTEVILASLLFVFSIEFFTQVFRLLVNPVGLAHDLTLGTALALAGIIVGEVVFFALLRSWLRGRGRTLASLGWGRPPPRRAIITAGTVGLVYGGLVFSNNPIVGAHIGDLTLLKLEGIVAAIAAAIVEETTFRGFIMSELQRIRVPVFVQILVSALAFGMVSPSTFSPSGFVTNFVLGIIFASIYVMGQRSLAPPFIGRMIIGVIIQPGWMMFLLSTAAVAH